MSLMAKAIAEEYTEHTTSVSFINMVFSDNGFKEYTTSKREALPKEILPVSFCPSIGRYILPSNGVREKLVIASACAGQCASQSRGMNVCKTRVLCNKQ